MDTINAGNYTAVIDYEGDENYTEELGCVGCYQYDPVAYRKQSAKRIAKEASENTTDFIMKKLYGDDE